MYEHNVGYFIAKHVFLHVALSLLSLVLKVAGGNNFFLMICSCVKSRPTTATEKKTLVKQAAGGLLPSAGCFPVNVLLFGDKEGTSRCSEENHINMVKCGTSSYYNTTLITDLSYCVVFVIYKDPIIFRMYF